MASLLIHGSEEVSLTLRGPEENRILVTVRRWPYWNQVRVERDPLDATRCLAVTLTTSRLNESTLREILRRSFGLSFPPGGGDSEILAAPREPGVRRRR
ncbi:MAG TPA: hypothetical protein VNL77_10545 [Roseiflexaceae bacterium]|nr:hypothetical protein [Roseiflexaceae bacterium]